jgi:N,N'-diacetyllegionaminate synthase
MSDRTLIIAEAGVNHNGDLDMARRLVDVAAHAGADLVKFQTFSADRLATRTARQAGYQVTNTGVEESQRDMLRRLELSPMAHRELIAHCAARGIGFFSTAFDLESLDLLVSLGQQLFKVPSGEITNFPYLRRVGALGGQVILSTGMATLAEIEAAIDLLEQSGTQRRDMTVLHCTTAYPTAMADVNLRAMQTIQAAFGVKTGYSDHTPGVEVAVAAVALGATVIEKHFTLDRQLPGPDHKASLEPDELALLVRSIRNIEAALGDGRKRPTAGELGNRKVARKIIVASRDIEANELLTEDNITTKRGGEGLSPMRWNEVVGKRAGRRYCADEAIE